MISEFPLQGNLSNLLAKSVSLHVQFAIVQVPLSLFSTTIYANRQQRLQNKLLLAVYCTLLVYEVSSEISLQSTGFFKPS